MRTEKEMFTLILDIANKEKRIHAVLMQGSRVDESVKKDIFQDFDIIYIVDNIKEIISEKAFFEQFGEALISQNSLLQKDSDLDPKNAFINMMQFTDGNRIDLTLIDREKLNLIKFDSNTKILLDKRGILKNYEIPKNSYLIKKPLQKEYYQVLNEFLWITLYVAKGLWRRELPYAKKCFEVILRAELEKMLVWMVGENTNYEVSIGKYNKYLEKHLKSDLWMDYQKTYVSGSYTDMWEGLLYALGLFDVVAKNVATANDFLYPQEEYNNILGYIKNIRSLPTNATSFYTEF